MSFSELSIKNFNYAIVNVSQQLNTTHYTVESVELNLFEACKKCPTNELPVNPYAPHYCIVPLNDFAISQMKSVDAADENNFLPSEVFELLPDYVTTAKFNYVSNELLDFETNHIF
jgi:hypothetical protein